MDGILGWLGEADTHQDLIRHMVQASKFAAHAPQLSHSNSAFGIAAESRFGKASCHVGNGIAAALHGRPQFADDELAAIAQGNSPALAIAEGWIRHGTKLPARMTGNFALAILHPARNQAFLAIDRMGIERLCYALTSNQLVFGTSLQGVAAHPDVGRTLDLQAVYEYLYFHMIPSPRSIYQGIRKLQPGQYLLLENGKTDTGFYWQADYTPSGNNNFDRYRSEFRNLLNESVKQAGSEPGTAAFLSGGTDSSTVVGVLTESRNSPVDTFSIGFDAEGFDEMEFARCAVERFHSRSHEYYLKPEDIVAAIPIIANEYDEPFGNASAVPTYFCAKAAREAGFTHMLAGDGGDEIFGGNARYAKQKMFEAYFWLPGAIRHGLVEPLANVPGLHSHFPLRKLKSYVDQANIPLPLRLETYNFLHRTPLADIFEPDFLGAVDPSLTDQALTAEYHRTRSEHFVNRLMHLDLKFTLADNDLRKVGTMTEAAGIEVRYPLLEDRMVDFANRLPVDYKVRRLHLRWFFKQALSDLLPEKIINKSKHGFGLPFGIWSNQHAPLAELIADSLSSLGKRGWIQPNYLQAMLAMQRGPHASYYGVMIWVALMLEQWMKAHE